MKELFKSSVPLPILSLLAALGLCATLSAQEKTTFVDHVLPLVEQHCAKCHNPDKKKGDLDLTSHSAALKGGGSGVAVMSGNPDSSKLIKVLAHSEEPNMPPNKPPLPEKDIAVFKKWIAGGLLESSGSKAIASAKPSVDLTFKATESGRPEGLPPMPGETLSMEAVAHTERGYAISGLAASPWAPLVALTGQKQILLYNLTNLTLLGILPFPDGQPLEVKFSRSGKVLLAAGGHAAKSGKVHLWNIESGERLTSIGNEYDAVQTADISPDQTRVALGGTDRLVKIHSIKTGELEHKIKKHTDWVTALAFSPNGEMLASADRNGGLTVWDADNGQELFTTAGHKAGVTALSWRGDSRVLASSSEDGTVKLWEASEGKQAKTWNAHAGGALSVAYSRDGRLVTCGRDGAVITWNAEGNKIKTHEFSGAMALRCTWSDDQTHIVASDFDGRVGIWNAKDGKRAGELDANPSSLAERIAAARKRLANLESGADSVSAELVTAELELKKIEAELEAAKTAAEAARADFAAKAREVARLKELATSAQPPAKIDSLLSDARSAREASRTVNTQATNSLADVTKRFTSAQQKVKQAKESFDPEAARTAARAELNRLLAALERERSLRAKTQSSKKTAVN